MDFSIEVFFSCFCMQQSHELLQKESWPFLATSCDNGRQIKGQKNRPLEQKCIALDFPQHFPVFYFFHSFIVLQISVGSTDLFKVENKSQIGSEKSHQVQNILVFYLHLNIDLQDFDILPF